MSTQRQCGRLGPAAEYTVVTTLGPAREQLFFQMPTHARVHDSRPCTCTCMWRAHAYAARAQAHKGTAGHLVSSALGEVHTQDVRRPTLDHRGTPDP
jgi:hypothetical protein